jgi:WD40 repeat protein
MQKITIEKSIATSFDRSSTGQEENINDGIQDGGIYIFDVDCFIDRSAIVSSSSDNCLALYDAETFITIRRIEAHNEMINSLCLSKTTSNSIFSVSNDHCVSCWDIRVAGNVPVIKIKLADDVTAIDVGISDTLLATGCSSAISFYDIRNCNNKTNKLGEYSDIHTDAVTQLQFSTANSQILASGAEDGLICLFDTSTADGDDAVISILNTECPVRKIGFFGAEDEAMYCLSTTETATFWHCGSAQRVGNFPTIREELVVDYLVDCIYDSNSDALRILAGNYNGGGKIAVVEPTSLHLCGQLPKGGHSASIRCAKHMSSSCNGSISRLITGGEDARLCGWNVSPAGANICNFDQSNSTNIYSEMNITNSFSLKAIQKATKKAERRQKPY